MSAWWRALWPKKPVSQPAVAPVPWIGGIYKLNQDSPFAERAVYAEVLEIRDGWVRYRYVGDTRDWSSRIDSFLGIYSPCIQEA